MKAWKKQNDSHEGPVFLNEETEKPFTTIKKAWENVRKEVDLKNFRWHDFCHHLAPEHKANAVEMLVKK